MTAKPERTLGRYALRDKYTPIPDRGTPVFTGRASLIAALETFMAALGADGAPRSQGFSGKGYLATMVKVTVLAARTEFPLEEDDFLTINRGQVRNVQVEKIMWSCGVRRSFSSEAGRTSRGTIGYARDYADLLNEIHGERGNFDLSIILAYWIARIRDLLDKQPLEIRYNPQNTFRDLLHRIIDVCRKRERDYSGSTTLGTVMQHLTGAILETSIGHGSMIHSKANKADRQYGRNGDFEIKKTVWHVTSAPTESLIQKCIDNIEGGSVPIIVTIEAKKQAAQALADNRGYQDRISVLSIEDLVEHQLLEDLCRGLSPTEAAGRLIGKYNRIAEDIEKDRSILIEIR